MAGLGTTAGMDRDRLVAELSRELRLLTRELVRFYAAAADQLGLRVTDLTCLGTLRDRGRTSPGELATELGLTTGAVSRMVDRLSRRGYVRRVPDPRDRRRVLVELVPDTQAPVVGLFAGHAADTAESLAGLSEAELRLLLRYVRDRTAVSRREADRLRRVGRPHATRRSRSGT